MTPVVGNSLESNRASDQVDHGPNRDHPQQVNTAGLTYKWGGKSEHSYWSLTPGRKQD